MNDLKISSEEWFEITRKIGQFHEVFYTLWSLGIPTLDSTIETAEVQFYQPNVVNFRFNPDFWNNLSVYQRIFVIAHECLHVILNHGNRGKDGKYQNLVNIAMDISVNHMLVENFGFDRKEVAKDELKNICFVDTVFKDAEDLVDIPENETFEWYYSRLIDEQEGGNSNDDKNSLDDHSGLTGSSDIPQSFLDELKDKISPEALESLNTAAGSDPGSKWMVLSVELVIKKKKWETIIKKWSMKYMREDFKAEEQWAILNRRFQFISDNLMIPSEFEIEETEQEKNKIPVFFFLDTSGSCHGFAERFWKAAKSLPEDKFDIRLFCFDTKVYETSLSSGKLYGFGGTMFNIIEQRIQQEKKYPEAVFLITDGIGSSVHPVYPDRWHWFLTPYNIKTYIPKQSNVYMLKDFE